MPVSAPNPVIVPRAGDAPIAVGLGQVVIARGQGVAVGGSLVAHSLGSCIAVTVFDPSTSVGGLLNFMLPDASACPTKAQTNPAMFADTGVPLLLARICSLGCDTKNLIICAAGGADIIAGEALFRIGERNRAMLRQVFWQNELLVRAHDTGGCHSRTLSLSLADGTVIVRTRGKEAVLWKKAA